MAIKQRYTVDTLGGAFNKHWPNLSPLVRRALVRLCQQPQRTAAEHWARDCVKALAQVPGQEYPARLALALINNVRYPAIRRMVLAQVPARNQLTARRGRPGGGGAGASLQ